MMTYMFSVVTKHQQHTYRLAIRVYAIDECITTITTEHYQLRGSSPHV